MERLVLLSLQCSDERSKAPQLAVSLVVDLTNRIASSGGVCQGPVEPAAGRRVHTGLSAGEPERAGAPGSPPVNQALCSTEAAGPHQPGAQQP